MSEKIGEQVSVYCIYDHIAHTTTPRYIKWKAQTYTIHQVGLQYPIHQGKVLIHMFSVANENICLLLSFNTESLIWRLEEISENYS